MTTYVFVPGAFHAGWSFDRVRPMLEKAGHRMLSPTLSGVGERAHLAALGSIDLDTHIEDIVQLVLWHGLKDIVLAGHSYGGMVITGVADRIADRIATLCYLDAAMPGNGDSLISLLPALVAPVAAASKVHGGRLVDPPPAAAFGVDPVYREWVDARLTPHPIGSFTKAIRLTGAYKAVARHSLIYNSRTQDASPFAAGYEALRDRLGYQVSALAAGHDLMIDGAAELADILLRQAR